MENVRIWSLIFLSITYLQEIIMLIEVQSSARFLLKERKWQKEYVDEIVCNKFNRNIPIFINTSYKIIRRPSVLTQYSLHGMDTLKFELTESCCSWFFI